MPSMPPNGGLAFGLVVVDAGLWTGWFWFVLQIVHFHEKNTRQTRSLTGILIPLHI